MSGNLVSHEVIDRIHRDQLRMLVIVAELERMARRKRDDAMVRMTTSLREALKEQTGLLGGVLDAVTTDAADLGRR